MFFLDEKKLLLFLIQLSIIIFLSRLLGEIFKKLKQPSLTAELLVGIILGPTILGRFFPQIFSQLFPSDNIQQTMLETVSWIGVLFLLLDTGLELNFSSIWRQKDNAIIIAILDIIIPMIVAFIPSFFLPDYYLVDSSKRILFALFMATTMTISAMPIASKVMHDLNLLKTELGYLTLSALAINDIIGWVLFTIIVGLFNSNQVKFGYVANIILFTISFSLIALTLGRKASTKIVDFFIKYKLPEPSTSFTYACILGIIFGAITQKSGVHALFGFFLAGVVVGEAKNLREETRNIISQMVHALFVPIFFVNVCLKVDFFLNFDLPLVLLITIIGIAGRYLGAWFGVSISKIPKINRNLISIAHTPGGMMEIVVAFITMELGLITQKIFTAIVCSAIISSMIMGPWMVYELNKRKKVNIVNFINFEHGVFCIESVSKLNAINEFLDKIKLIDKNVIDNEITFELTTRENMFSTGLEDGLAIPHIRTDKIKNPIILFGLSKSGLDWNSIDGKPTHFIFFIVSPKSTNDLHIEIISKIIQTYKKNNFKDNLLTLNDVTSLKEKLKSIFS